MTGRVCQDTFDPTVHQPVYQDCQASDLSCGGLFTTRTLGDYRVMTNTARLALAGGDLYVGLTVGISDTALASRVYTWDGAAWRLVGYGSQASRPGGHWKRNAAQAITPSVETAIIWDVEVRDNDAGLALPSATWTTPFTGTWSVMANHKYSGDPQNHWHGFKMVIAAVTEYHGVQGFSDAALMGPAANQGPVGTSTGPLVLAAGDTVQYVVFYDSATPRTVTSDRFEVYYHGP